MKIFLKTKDVVQLMRPHQYVKNLFIFFPLFFAGQITNIELLSKSFVAFLAFCLTASSIYILNDIKDVNEDREHSKKKYRPITSGLISEKIGSFLIVILALSGAILIFSQSLKALAILGVYFILNIGYCYRLKHIPLIDVTIIAVGFVLRVYLGAAVTGVHITHWIVLMTFLLALFLAIAKRRDDVLHFLDTGKKMRKVIDGYNLQLVDSIMIIMASVVIVTYILYTTSAEVLLRIQNEYLYITTLFVILGIMRYLQISFVEKNSGSPSNILLKDRLLQLVLLAWILAFTYIIYF